MPDECALQRALADLIFEPSADEAFDRDPAGFGVARGLEAQDTAALLRFKDRLGVYRDLARASLEEPLLNIFPVTRALLGDRWEACAAAFLAARTLRSPHYRDIAPAFVTWLSVSGWGRETWPCLLSVAHFECVEVMVGRWPAEATGEPLAPEPSPERRIVLSPGAQVLAYACAVHRATVDAPLPPEAPTHLLAYGDPAGEFRILELTPATAALLVRGQEESLGASAVALDLHDPEGMMSLLRELADGGAIQGFR